MGSARVVLISGGTRGLGAELVRRCLAARYRVATFSRSASDAVDRFSACEEHAERFVFEPVDADDAQALQRFVSSVVRRFGRLDAVVNNAATGRFGPFATARLKDIEDSLAINVAGAMTLCRLCTPHLLANRGGAIVNISSVNAVRGHSGVAIYSATKAALDGFTRALARELGPGNVRVNSVAPGYFQSEMTAGLTPAQLSRLRRGTPLGRLGDVGEIAAAVMFLLSDEASFITGQTLAVDGGVTC